MRLLDTRTLEVIEFAFPPLDYGILSHTWESGEASFKDVEAGLLQSGNSEGIQKIRKVCELAWLDKLKYV